MNKEQLDHCIQTNEAVMVYFSGNDCGVCHALQPKVKDLFDTKFPQIQQVYIKSEEYRDTAAQVNVLSVPTVIVFFDHKEFVREARLISLQDLEVKISRTYDLFFN